MDTDEWARRAGSFGEQAAAYERGRPGYPAEAVRWCLPDGARRVLDLGAGTGKLTRTLLDLGLDVVAVEPLEQMRVLVPAPAVVLDGRAEALPLADASVDAVLVGQAFHWFDQARALPELARVLRPGGGLGLLWNLYDDSVPWVDELATVADGVARASLVPEHPDPPYPGAPGLTVPEHRSFRHTNHLDVDELVAYVRSTSTVILMSEPEREQVVARVREVAPRGRFALPYVCSTYRSWRTAP